MASGGDGSVVIVVVGEIAKDEMEIGRSIVKVVEFVNVQARSMQEETWDQTSRLRDVVVVVPGARNARRKRDCKDKPKKS